MHSKLAWFLTLAVFSGMSMNLILRFGIGLQRIGMEGDSRNSGKDSKPAFIVWPVIYFISLMLLWLFFSGVQSVIFLGFVEYILVFPVSSILFSVIEYLAARLAFKTSNRSINDWFFIGDAPTDGAMAGGAPIGAALFIILGLAGSFAEAAMLSFGFSAGAALAVLIVGEIRRRSAMEAVPRSLKGDPLVLIAMGLLSLVLISAATVFYAVLGAN